MLLVGGLCLIGALLLYIFLGSGDSEPTIVEPIRQGNGANKTAAITINVDWGEDIVPKMLSVLAEKEVKATFFVTGRFCEKFPEVVKAISDAGHEIGNHGYAHPHHDQISVADNVKDIQKGQEALEKITGTKPILFAPAYGEHGENCLKAAEENGNQVILWTLDTIDWQTPAPDTKTLVERVAGEKLVNGAILLLHPKEHTLKALPEIIDTIQQKGYTLKTVSEIL